MTVAIVAGLFTLLLGASVASAQDEPYPPPTPSPDGQQAVAAECSGEFESGGEVVCTAGGFAAGSEVTVEVLGEFIVCDTGGETEDYEFEFTRTADSAGEVTARFELPEGATGETTVRFSGQDPEGEPRVAEDAFEADPAGECSPSGQPSGGPLPVTGTNAMSLGLIGLLALALGGLTVGGAKWMRRRNEATF